MEEYKLLDFQDNMLYFSHVIKNNSYESSTSQQLYDALPSFSLKNQNDKIVDKDRIIVIFEISIIDKSLNLLILQDHQNQHTTNTSCKTTINSYDSLLKRYLMKGVSKLTITYNLIDPLSNKGVLTIDKNLGNLKGERSFVRKYRLSLSNIIVGYVGDKRAKKEEQKLYVSFNNEIKEEKTSK